MIFFVRIEIFLDLIQVRYLLGIKFKKQHLKNWLKNLMSERFEPFKNDILPFVMKLYDILEVAFCLFRIHALINLYLGQIMGQKLKLKILKNWKLMCFLITFVIGMFYPLQGSLICMSSRNLIKADVKEIMFFMLIKTLSNTICNLFF